MCVFIGCEYDYISRIYVVLVICMHELNVLSHLYALQDAITDIQVVSNGFLTCGGDGSVKLVQLKDFPHGL